MARPDASGLASRLPLLLSAAADLALLRPGLRAAGYLAKRWLPDSDPHAPHLPETSLNVALGVAADEGFRTLMVAMAHVPRGAELNRIIEECRLAASLFEERGWLAEPTRYHRQPPELKAPVVASASSWGRNYQHLRFISEYEPFVGEPGRERWLGYRPVREGHAWMLRHRGRPRPWIVCLHGFRMGFPLADFHAFRIGWMHNELGLNVLMPVLPLHGPRKVGRRSGDGFFGAAMLDAVHAEAQAIWDLRRLLGWLRAQQDGGEIAVYGVSLGAYTCALLAGIDASFSCAIAALPTTCLAALMREHTPPAVMREASAAGLSWAQVERLLQVISPLAVNPLVPPGGRHVLAAAADRLVPGSQADALGRHWGPDTLSWFQGTHLSFSWQGRVINSLVESALRRSGVLTTDHGRSRQRTAA